MLEKNRHMNLFSSDFKLKLFIVSARFVCERLVTNTLDVFLNCASHKIWNKINGHRAAPSTKPSAPPALRSSIHPHPCSPLSHPAYTPVLTGPALLCTNKPKQLMFHCTIPFFSPEPQTSQSFSTNQNPPFCLVQSTNSVAAISQTLQYSAHRLMQRREHIVITAGVLC